MRLADSFEPDGPLGGIKTNELEGLAAVKLSEVFQPHAEWMNSRSHPILKIAQPAESAERFGIASYDPIRRSQMTGLEGAVLLVPQKVRDCVMDRKPIHFFR